MMLERYDKMVEIECNKIMINSLKIRKPRLTIRALSAKKDLQQISSRSLVFKDFNNDQSL